jgi:hypothetical protein
MPQNSLSLHLNVAEVRAEAQDIENIITQLYTQLEKYDNAKISPINITGVAELTAAIKAQQVQMDALTTSVTNLGSAVVNYNTNISSTAGATSTSSAAIQANTAAITANTAAINANVGAGTRQKTQSQGQLGVYDQLIQKQKLLNQQYREAIASGAPKGVQDTLKRDLTTVNQQVDEINKTANKTASGGIAGMGRGMGSFLNQVRQLAYILPGIGMAGIFNLAFEAINKVLEALAGTNDEISRQIELEKTLADLLGKTNELIKERADLYAQQQTTPEVQYYERLKTIQDATGQGYQNEMQQIDDLNKAQKQAADERVENLNATYSEQSQLNTKLLELNDRRTKAVKGLTDAEKGLTDAQNEPIPLHGAGEALVRRNADIRTYQTLKDSFTKELESLEAQSTSLNKRYTDVSSALATQSQANANIEIEANKRSLYWDDEHRKTTLSNIQKEVEATKIRSKAVLDDINSTTQQRIQAEKDIRDATNKGAQGQYMFAITAADAKNSASKQAEALTARNNAIGAANEQFTAQETKLNLDYWLKMLEYQIKGQEDIYKTNQLYNKALFEDDQESYDKRLNAFGNYNQSRVDAAEAQYKHDIEVISTLPADQQEAARNERKLRLQEEYADIENGIRKQSYDIATDFYKKQLKDIEDFDEKSINEARDAERNELALTNDKFAKGKISYRKYNQEIAKEQYDGEVNILKATIQADKDEIGKLQTARETLQTQQRGAALGMAFSFGNKNAYQTALGAYQGFSKDLIDNQKGTNEAQNKLSKDQYDLEALQQKATLDARKQTAANWAEFEKQAFEDVKQVGDSYFENRIAQIEYLTEQYDKAADAEIGAIERSTLASKDKNAYEVQLQAQKTQRDKEAAKEERKLKHDEAVFNKAVDIAQIITSTEVAVAGALASVALGVPPPVAAAEALSFAALGAISLATAAATKIPSYKYGGTHEKSGLALFGEGGSELVMEPGTLPYIANKPTLKHLPANTELIPLYQIPEIPEKQDNSWAQTLYLGKAIAKSKREIKNVFKPKININLDRELYINRIIHG